MVEKNKARALLGFRDSDRGTHSSRTIMLAELRLLFDMNAPESSKNDYRHSVIETNVLGKRTGSTRKLSMQRLSELYGLDPSIPVFRVLRHFWEVDQDGRALLAFLCAFARDPLLRLTTPAVLAAEQGQTIRTADIEHTIAEAVPGRFNPSIQNKVARNAGSSWTQSGHLIGRARKVRARPIVTVATAAYAVFLGYLEGIRAQRLFETIWVRLLDCPVEDVFSLVAAASRRGLLDYRNVGSVVEVRFPNLLSTEEEELIREQS